MPLMVSKFLIPLVFVEINPHFLFQKTTTISVSSARLQKLQIGALNFGFGQHFTFGFGCQLVSMFSIAR
jgi:hypothetical protein